MTTTIRRLIRRNLFPILALAVVAGSLDRGIAPAQAQAAKEPTDGFFDVPHREGAPAWGLPEYLVTSALTGAAVFILCKSSRRT